MHFEMLVERQIRAVLSYGEDEESKTNAKSARKVKGGFSYQNSPSTHLEGLALEHTRSEINALTAHRRIADTLAKASNKTRGEYGVKGTRLTLIL